MKKQEVHSIENIDYWIWIRKKSKLQCSCLKSKKVFSNNDLYLGCEKEIKQHIDSCEHKTISLRHKRRPQAGKKNLRKK